MVGRIITPRTIAAASTERPGPPATSSDEGREDHDADEAEDDRGDAREELDRGLHDAHHPRRAELREEDGAGYAQGRADEEGAQGHPERGDDHREYAVVTRVGPPVRGEEEVPQAHLEEEGQGPP